MNVRYIFPISHLVGVLSNLEARQKNLFFNGEAIRRVQADLVHLDLGAGSRKPLEEFYKTFLACFYDHGRESKPKRDSPRLEPWMTFLSSDELEVQMVLFIINHQS